MIVDDELKQGIWEEYIEDFKEEEKARTLQPGEMTIKMFAEVSGTSTFQARKYLDGLVKKGKLEVRQLATRNAPLVYKPVA